MRQGLAVSAGTHALLIGLGLVSLGWAEALPPPPVDSIAVDLVPITEVANIRVGDLDSRVVETEAPSAVDTEEAPELAQRTGNTETDQPDPKPTDTPSPAPSVSSAPEPVPEPEPEPEPIPPAAEPPPPEPAAPPQRVAVAEPPPVAAPAPEPVLTAPAVEPEPAEAAPAPVMRTASLEQKRAAFKAQQEADAKAAEEKKRKEAEAKAAEEKKRKDAEAKAVADAKAAEDKKRKEVEAKRVADAKAAEQKQAKAADDISDIINRESSRGAVSGKGGQKTLGKADGKAATLSQSEMDGLVAAIRTCWNVPMGAQDAGFTVRLRFSLSPGGMVTGNPQVVSSPASALEDQTGQAAARAVLQCAPYTMLDPAKYDQWAQIEATFDPRDVRF